MCVKVGHFVFWGESFFFFERGLGRKSETEREGKKREEFLVFFPLSSTHTLSRLLCSLAREGSRHVGLADGGLGGQDSDLFFFFFERGRQGTKKVSIFFWEKGFPFSTPQMSLLRGQSSSPSPSSPSFFYLVDGGVDGLADSQVVHGVGGLFF